MTDLEIIRQARARRAAREAAAQRRRRERRRRRARIALGLATLGAVLAAVALATRPTRHDARPGRVLVAGPTLLAPRPQHRENAYARRLSPTQIDARLKHPLRSGMLFDVRTGTVLWQRAPARQLPIASLTKMMTALVVVAHARPRSSVTITRDALHYSGSGVGLLPLGRRIPVRTLLYGLLLPSGNDAAIALAEHVGRTQPRFIAMMNAAARHMGLSCSHFSTVSGIVDVRNHSCASDLAVIAHAVLRQPLLARIVASRSAVLPFPIKGRRIFLYNNNPLLRSQYPGADGVKTGFTTLAGECLVASARRGHTWLGVVLLNSGDPRDQAIELLNAGFATPGA